MYSPSKQLQTPEDEDQPEDGDHRRSKNAVIKELMKDDRNFASPKLKANKRRAETTRVHGGRVIHPTGKKDRHSKVSTARGPRDRRVRLAPRTAIEFYDVQDRLGYDRPSKAIDWLIKKAKSAIDALDEQPLFAASASRNIQKHDYFNYEKPVFGLGFFLDGSAPRNRNEAENAIFQPSYEQGFCSALTANCADENSVIAGGGGGAEYFPFNSPPPLHFPAGPILGHGQMFSQREPLQSSIINYSPISTHLSGFDFSDELLNITAATILTEDEKDKSVFRRQYSAASFPHYED